MTILCILSPTLINLRRLQILRVLDTDCNGKFSFERVVKVFPKLNRGKQRAAGTFHEVLLRQVQ